MKIPLVYLIFGFCFCLSCSGCCGCCGCFGCSSWNPPRYCHRRIHSPCCLFNKELLLWNIPHATSLFMVVLSPQPILLVFLFLHENVANGTSYNLVLVFAFCNLARIHLFHPSYSSFKKTFVLCFLASSPFRSDERIIRVDTQSCITQSEGYFETCAVNVESGKGKPDWIFVTNFGELQDQKKINSNPKQSSHSNRYGKKTQKKNNSKSNVG